MELETCCFGHPNRAAFQGLAKDLVIKRACQQDFDSEALHLARAASIVRRDMFSMKQTFRGTLEAHCKKKSIPPSLLALVEMILQGPSTTKEKPEEKPFKTPALPIA